MLSERRRLSCALASPLALALLCALDIRGAASPFGVLPAAVLAGAVFSVGTLHGALWDLAFNALVARLRCARVPPSGAWSRARSRPALAIELGAFARVGGAYRGLAISILVACGLGAPLFAGVLIGDAADARSAARLARRRHAARACARGSRAPARGRGLLHRRSTPVRRLVSGGSPRAAARLCVARHVRAVREPARAGFRRAHQDALARAARDLRAHARARGVARAPS